MPPHDVTVPRATSEMIPVGATRLDGDLVVPAHPIGLVLFAHGSGSSRHSPRNRQVAAVLQRHGLATLLSDLLTVAEERADAYTAQHRFDIRLLALRLGAIVDWLATREDLAGQWLRAVRAPTRLIVGSLDEPVIALNRQAMAEMPGLVDLQIVAGATHLFEEPGTLDRAADLAGHWYVRHLRAKAAAAEV